MVVILRYVWHYVILARQQAGDFSCYQFCGAYCVESMGV